MKSVRIISISFFLLFTLISLLFVYDNCCLERSGVANFDKGLFSFISGKDAAVVQLMECPNHFGETREVGLLELQKRIDKKKPGDLLFVQFCVYHQRESIMTYGPYVQAFGINPFASVDVQTKDLDSPNIMPSSFKDAWVHVNHPILNRLRFLNSARWDKVRSFARVDLSSLEPGVWKNRQPSREEIKWCIIALLGSGYSGVIWVGENETNQVLVKSIESNFSGLNSYGKEVKQSGRIAESNDFFVNLIETSDEYILCVLSHEFVQINLTSSKGEFDSNILPQSSLDPDALSNGEISIENAMARDVSSIKDAKFLLHSGKFNVVTTKENGNSVVLNCELRGSSDVIIWRKKPKEK